MTEYGPASRIVIVGGSIAGLTAARQLRAIGFRGALTVVDRDPESPYRRPEVSKKMLVEQIRGRTRLTWPTELQVELRPARVAALDLPRRTITLADRPAATGVSFDGLVIASGARARKPPFNSNGDGVHWLRSASDAARLRAALADCRRICVVGGGLIGLEVAALGWLEGNGLDLADGVRCDDHCAVIGAAGVVACGDVASWFNPLLRRQMRVEHWTNAIEQGEYAARRLLGAHPPTGFASLPYFWSDQGDLKLQLLGSSEGHDEVVVLESSATSLVAEYRSEGRLLAVAGINAGPAVMARRPEIMRAYQQRSLADIGLG